MVEVLPEGGREGAREGGLREKKGRREEREIDVPVPGGP
jgi:hypothetical protein